MVQTLPMQYELSYFRRLLAAWEQWSRERPTPQALRTRDMWRSRVERLEQRIEEARRGSAQGIS